MLIDHIKQLGLDDKQAKLYLLCLEYGTVQATRLAHLSGIKRTTCYDYLHPLVMQGFLTETKQRGSTWYTAVAPTVLFEKLQQKSHAFEAILPQLLELSYGFAVSPKIQIFHGAEGMKALYLDTLQSSGIIKAYLGNSAIHAELDERFVHEYIPARVNKKLFAQVITVDTSVNKLYQADDTLFFRETRFAVNGLFDRGCEVNMYGENKVMIALYSGTDMHGLLIESEQFFLMMCSVFDTLRGNK